MTLYDLGGDLEHLEEVGLSRVATGGAGRDNDVHGGDGTNTGRGGDTVGQDEVTDFGKVVVGEHETDVAGHLVLDLGVEVAGVGLHEIGKDLLHQGVLTHEDLGLSTHGSSGGVHLLRADVIDTDNEDLVVGRQHASHLLEVLLLLILGQRHSD